MVSARGLSKLEWGCRGGPHSADHVDILSNVDLLTDVIKIVAGAGHELKDVIISDISRIADNIPVDAV
jgi:hypothetical protein